jgi:diacylglycerol kinase family enzyme
VNITCPARAATEDRTQQGASYAAKARFWSDTSIYPYPYCQVDLSYYLNTPVVTTNVNQAHIKVLLPTAQLATPA